MVKLNSKLKKIGAPILAGVLVCSTVLFYVPHMNTANAATDSEKTLKKTYPELLENAASGDKSETVYAVLDADGNTSEVSVSEWLKNSGDGNIKDYSTLKNITNTSGDEEYAQDGNNLVWDADGNDISYTGDYDGELPVKVKVTYSLDGTEMSAKEIAGKSGNVTIRFDYTVNDSVSVDGYSMTRPYAIISALVLSNDNFSNVTVNNGKAINDGDNTAVVGIALPGVSSDLNISSLDIPDHVTITAKTTNFEIDGTYTVADSGFMSDTDTSKLDDASSLVDKLEKSLNQLSDASTQLVDGSEQLAEGASTLASSTSQIKEGTEQVSDGAKQVDAGVDSLSENTATLVTGAQSLSAGTTQLKEGTSKLQKSVTGEGGLTESTAALKAGAAEVSKGVGQLGTTITSVAGTVNTISETLKDVNTDAVTEPSHDEVDEALDAAIKAAEKAGDQDTVDALNSAKDKLGDYESDVKETVDSVNTDSKSVQTAKATADALYQQLTSEESTKSLQTLTKGAESLATGTSKLDSAVGAKTEDGKSYKDGTLAAAVTSLNAGAASLDAGVNGYTDAEGNFHMGALQGINALETGINTTLKTGTSSLATGADQIVTYMGQLSDGANTLSEGAETLSTSMNTFNEEGIEKLVSTIDKKDLKSTVNRVKATIDAASYGSFVGGKTSDQNGESKIIFKTGEVKKADKSDKSDK